MCDDLLVHLLESARSVVAGSAEAHYVQLQGICSGFLYPCGEFLPFAVGVAGNGGDDRDSAGFLGLTDEIQIVGQDFFADVAGEIVVGFRVNVRVVCGNLHRDALFE